MDLLNWLYRINYLRLNTNLALNLLTSIELLQ